MSLQGPYVWDEHRSIPWWPRIVDTYELHHLAACSVDGWSMMRIRAADTSIRRNVNPDRHARIRAKHFAYAALNASCDTIDPLYEDGFTAAGEFAWGRAMDRHEAVHTWMAAFDACGWGVS